jgi:hypothetical protein
VVIRKPGKDDYMKLKAYRPILLRGSKGNVVEKVGAELISNQAKKRGLPRDGQFRSRNGQPAINAAAIMVDRSDADWTNGHRTGVLLMDIETAFPSMANGRLVNLMTVREIDRVLVRGMVSFLS